MRERSAKHGYKIPIAVLKRDTTLARLIKKYGPLDPSWPNLGKGIFQALLRSIIFQQLSGNAARAIHGRVLAFFADGRPTPGALLKIRIQKLRAAGLSAQKIEYVRDLARKFLDGTVEEKRLPKLSSEEIIRHLTAVKGVGEWSAQMILIFTMHRLDILPTGDLGVKKGFQAAYHLRTLPTKRKMKALATPWKGYESIASLYLWRAADEAKK